MQIFKSTDGGLTWVDVGRLANRTCRINAEVMDIATVPGSDQDVYFVDNSFAGVWRSSDQLTSSGQARQELVNCFDLTFRLAVDPVSPNRITAAGPCEGSLHWGFSSDGGSTKNYTRSEGSRLRDVAGQAGVFIAVGDAGKIEQTFDGRETFPQPADGVLQTKDWRAVDFLDAGRAAVGGVTGALAVSERANEMPDVVAPTLSIAGPATATAGAPVTLTANAPRRPTWSTSSPPRRPCSPSRPPRSRRSSAAWPGRRAGS